MSVLKQFESLTKEEILLLCEGLEQGIKFSRERLLQFNQVYQSYSELKDSLIIDYESSRFLYELKDQIDKSESRIKMTEVILSKLKVFEDIL